MTEHIRIGDIRPRIQYVGNGAVTAFAFPFPVFASSDLAVYLGDALQTDGFEVSGVGLSGGGGVTFAAAPAPGVVVTLSRAVPIARTTDFQEGGVFRANVINEELDRIVCMAQQLSEDLDRVVKRPATSTSEASLGLPEPVPGRALKFAADGALTVSAFDPDAAQASATAAVAAAQAAAAGVAASVAAQISLAETAAATAQTARDITLDALDHFDDRYLGANARDPATDNDGDPLVGGALYFDTTGGVMKLYNGSEWIAAYVSGGEYIPGESILGMIAPFERNSAPPKWVSIEDVGVLCADHADYVAACYVGDAANATASSRYRFNDLANPMASRSTTGAYIRLPPLADRVLRVAGAHSVAGQLLDDAFQGHWHDVYGSADTNGGAGWIAGKAGNQLLMPGGKVADPKTDGIHGAPRTSDETRMKSYTPPLWCVRVKI